MADEQNTRTEARRKILELAHELWQVGEMDAKDRNAIAGICLQSDEAVEVTLPDELYAFVVHASLGKYLGPEEYIRDLVRIHCRMHPEIAVRPPERDRMGAASSELGSRVGSANKNPTANLKNAASLARRVDELMDMHDGQGPEEGTKELAELAWLTELQERRENEKRSAHREASGRPRREDRTEPHGKPEP